MAYVRAFSGFFCVLLLSAVALEAIAQSASSRRSGVQAPPAAVNAPVEDTDAKMYAQAKADAEAAYERMEKDYEEKYIPALIESELAHAKIMFSSENGREPNSEELQLMRIRARETAEQHRAKALAAQRKGMAQTLARYAAYQNDVREQQRAKREQIESENEAIGLPKDLHGMFVVMSNGMVFSVVNRSDQDQYYPYKLYVESLSGMSREAGRSVGEMMAKARYNYLTQSFDYKEALDYTNAFSIPLNYEIVKQSCGTIYTDDDISFKFVASDFQSGAVTQWNAKSEGMVCPYLDMDYANCRVKRCLKQMPYKETVTVLGDRAAAMALGRQYLAETEKVRKSFAERKAELAEIVDEVNAQSVQAQRQDARTNCPRALCEDTVINQFIIDQAWGRAPTEKPVF